MNSKIKSSLISLSKNHTVFRLPMRKALYIKNRLKYLTDNLTVKTMENTVIFCAYNGKSYACSPKAIYEYMLSVPKYKGYNFIWIFKEPEKHKDVAANPNTKIVKYHTRQCNIALRQAKYWFFNFRALEHWIPTKKQVYTQCWHGTPLKRLGYDINGSHNAMNSQKELRDKYRTDAKHFKYLLSPSAFTSKRLYDAFNLGENNPNARIVEEGYPRNDFLVNHTDEDVEKIKEKLHIPNDKKVILYAPTWRDNQHDSRLGYVYKLGIDFDKLRSDLEDEYVILFRPHYFIANSFDFKRYDGFVINAAGVDDINELYIVSDMLITDYSSVFFDYAILKRPVIFFMYDIEEYKNDIRGFYLELSELPGPVVTEEKELLSQIRHKSEHFSYDSRYKSFNKRFNYLEDGKASGRVVKTIVEEREK